MIDETRESAAADLGEARDRIGETREALERMLAAHDGDLDAIRRVVSRLERIEAEVARVEQVVAGQAPVARKSPMRLTFLLPLAFSFALASGPSARAQAPAAENQGSGPGYEMLESLLTRAKAASDAGDADTAARLASEALAKSTDRASWNYGNVVYQANELLGLAAFQKGDIAAAKRYLIAAGKTPGSPQLDSFGPEMTLAQKLLDKGETSTVLEFLDEVAKFWAASKPGDPESSIALHRQHAATLEGWKAEIRAGGTPHLDRFSFPIPAWTYILPISIACSLLLVSSYRNRHRDSR